jgi:hypothetical protein
MNSCEDYAILTERTFGAFFEQHGFKRLGAPTFHGNDRKAGGPLCVWFFESPECRLKFYHGDGEINLLVGNARAPLNRIYEDQGWRYIRSLVPEEKTHPSVGDELGRLLRLLESNYSSVVEAVNAS